MTNLSNILLKDFKTSLINKDTIQKNTLQMLRAEILNKSKDLHRDLNEEEILEIIAKEIKQKQGAIDEFRKGNRDDLVEQAELEITTLEKYMPAPLSLEELKTIISETQSELNIYQMNGMGQLIKEVKAQTGIRADGRTISQLVKEVLI